MEASNKIRISGNLLFIKILFAFVIIFVSVLIIQDSRNENADFKTSLEQKIVLILFVSFFIYFLTIPIIYHDEFNMYIKKFNKREIIIPFKSIKSIFDNPLSTYRGMRSYSVEYSDNNQEIKSITFRAPYTSNKVSNFCNIIKIENPKVKII